MNKVAFLFCVHNHQPVGNFAHILQDAYERAYLPFIEVLQKYPFMKISVHYTGILLDFFKDQHPEFLEILKGLVKKGQIELMTGGYYEPILSVIPDEDKVGQIKRLSQTIEESMGVRPRGMWLAERVWEPHLPRYLAEAGVEYITIDDYHFKKSGLREEELHGYYVTEEIGKTVKVFPGSEILRYIIPFRVPEETLEYLSRLRDSSGAAIFADDGEKFGIWPYTYHSVYEERWLERLFELIGKNLDWIEPMPLGAYADREKPISRIYLACSSYMEMDEWSLPTEAMAEYGKVVDKLKDLPEGEKIRRFIKGGFWRNFFAKYPESNDMHKRVHHLRERIGNAKNKIVQDRDQDPIYYLHRAECNDAYWHGVFGGLYLPHLRQAIYGNLIKAEALYDRKSHREKEWSETERLDFNADGDEEVILKNADTVLIFSGRGGSLLEMDDRSKAFNILSTLTRRKEGYHQKLLESLKQVSPDKTQDVQAKTVHEMFESREKDLDQYLHFDDYRRASFLDHFIAESTDFESFRKCRYKEEGDFIREPYGIEIKKKSGQEILFSRLGNLQSDGKGDLINIEKSFSLPGRGKVVTASYHIGYEGEKRKTNFGIELNINLLAGNAPDRYYHIPGRPLEDRKLASTGALEGVPEIQLVDEWVGMKVVLKMDRNCNLWRFPIETVSISESGFERIYQGSCLLLYWPLELEPGKGFQVSVELGIYSLKD